MVTHCCLCTEGQHMSPGKRLKTQYLPCSQGKTVCTHSPQPQSTVAPYYNGSFDMVFIPIAHKKRNRLREDFQKRQLKWLVSVKDGHSPAQIIKWTCKNVASNRNIIRKVFRAGTLDDVLWWVLGVWLWLSGNCTAAHMHLTPETRLSASRPSRSH